MADGADLEYRALFLLNLTPEWCALFPEEREPEKASSQSKSSISKGCTVIHLHIISGTDQVYLGHTEDINPHLRDCGYIVQAEIYRDENKEELIECFTEYVTAGVLPGAKFGFNRHGLMYGSNSILQKEINLSGLPTKFALRPVVAAKDIDSMKGILKSYPGIATAIAYNILYREKTENRDRVVDCVFEIAGDPQHGYVYQEYYPTAVYHHCNTLQLLQVPCHPAITTPHRQRVLEKLIAENNLSSYDDLIKALGNQENQEYPIFRTGEPPDRLATVAVAIFDGNNMMMTVYDGKPGECPGLVLQIKTK